MQARRSLSQAEVQHQVNVLSLANQWFKFIDPAQSKRQIRKDIDTIIKTKRNILLNSTTNSSAIQKGQKLISDVHRIMIKQLDNDYKIQYKRCQT